MAYPNEEARGCADYVSPTRLAFVGSIGSGSKVLDIGRGSGAFAGLIVARDCEVVGVDLGRRRIEIASAAHTDGRIEIAAADDNLLRTLSEDAVDIVVSITVIEHRYTPISFFWGVTTARVGPATE